MIENRLEKKFIYNEGDLSHKFFILNSMFKKTYSQRKINSIYYDTQSHKDVWDNINGFGNRKKLRIRWYNEINNSDVFFEEKRKINFVTQKVVKKIGKFQNYNELLKFLDSEKFHNSDLINKYEKNYIKTIFIQYERNYYELPNKKLRLTVDKNIKIFNQFPKNFLNLDETILELKYDLKNSDFVNNFIKEQNLNDRNKKFSTYVYSFITFNESGLV